MLMIGRTDGRTVGRAGRAGGLAGREGAYCRYFLFCGAIDKHRLFLPYCTKKIKPSQTKQSVDTSNSTILLGFFLCSLY